MKLGKAQSCLGFLPLALSRLSEFELWSSEARDTQHPPPHGLGILEGDKDQIKSLQPDTIELRIELVSQLFLQLAVVLLRIYLGQEEALRAGEVRTRGAWFSPRGFSRAAALLPWNSDMLTLHSTPCP